MSTPDSDPAEASNPSDAAVATSALDRLLASRWLVPGLATAVLLALVFFIWAVRSTLDSMCFDDLKAAGLDSATALLLSDAGSFANGMKKGPSDGVKWSEALKGEFRKANERANEGRRALKRHEGRSALAAVADVEKALATAKQLAAERVNYILQVRNPDKPDEFEQYRLEGKSLVDAIREINSQLETLGARNTKLPGTCAW